ncbi:MAG: septum formation initiator family protein [Treponema sp.]|nr:septum formation initiator family protein [Treponema sp.]
MAGILVYITLSIFAGQNGIKSYRQLEIQRMEISKRTAAILQINEELKLEKNALQYDTDVIAAYARSLDYVKEGEKLVKINGLKPFENTLFDTGTVLREESISYIPDSVCKILGLLIFTMTLILFFILDLMNRKNNPKISVQGIPIYDPKQI